MLEHTSGAIVSSLKSGNIVSIQGFGNFEPREKQEREIVNPTTKEVIKVPAKVSINFKADATVSSRDLYATYQQWCEDNATHALSQKALTSFLRQSEHKYNLEYTNKVSIGSGRLARGFWGIELIPRPWP